MSEAELKQLRIDIMREMLLFELQNIRFFGRQSIKDKANEQARHWLNRLGGLGAIW